MTLDVFLGQYAYDCMIQTTIKPRKIRGGIWYTKLELYWVTSECIHSDRFEETYSESIDLVETIRIWFKHDTKEVLGTISVMA